MISIKRLAKESGINTKNMARFARSIGIEPVKMRHIDTSGRIGLCVTETQANLIREERKYFPNKTKTNKGERL